MRFSFKNNYRVHTIIDHSEDKRSSNKFKQVETKI